MYNPSILKIQNADERNRRSIKHGETYHVRGLEDNIVKISILPKLIHEFHVISNKIPPVKILCRHKDYSKMYTEKQRN